MFNLKLMSAPENWFIIFLMVMIALVGMHIFVDALNNN